MKTSISYHLARTAMSRVLLFIISLSALVASIDGRVACGSTPTSADMYQKQMEYADESARRSGRIGLECETQGDAGGSSGSSTVGHTILGFLILFFMFGTPMAICYACIRRQKDINAANLNNISGQVVGTQVTHGTDLKSYPQTKPVQKEDPEYKV